MAYSPWITLCLMLGYYTNGCMKNEKAKKVKNSVDFRLEIDETLCKIIIPILKLAGKKSLQKRHLREKA